MERRRDHHGNTDGQLRFPTAHKNDGLLVRATCDGRKLWDALFAFGTGRPDAFWFFPASSVAIVVVSGGAYRVDVLAPTSWLELDSDATAVVVSAASSCVALCDSGATVTIVRENGPVERHVFEHADGFREMRIADDTVVGIYHAYDRDVDEMPFAIALHDSHHAPSYLAPRNDEATQP